MPRELTAEQIEQTRAAMDNNRREDGSYNWEQLAKELELLPYAAKYRVHNLEVGKYKEKLTRPVAIHDPDSVAITLFSDKNNRYTIGACGDLHAASKYTRWDVREDLFKWYERENCQAVVDTGNWCDGEARFNRYDLECVGMESQVQLLADRHPRTHLPIYAVSGDDHEGWWEQSSGINIGAYAERIMRAGWHDWTDLGFMEAYIRLVNGNTGVEAVLSVVHPGGGSAYALSYAIQKIVESLEGGEKPNVAVYGHYHKLWAGIVRNVFVAQTGTSQDQTPFMRKKRLEAQVGGTLLRLEQDPETGAILQMDAPLRRYFNVGYYNGRWNHSGRVNQPPKDRIRGPGYGFRA
jgi:hypothetical protein